MDLSNVKVVVLGAGLIGSGWAALFLHHGAHVTLWDPEAKALETVQDRMAGPLAQLAQILPDVGAAGRLTLQGDLAKAVQHADLIQENAPESIPVKQTLYEQVEAAAPQDAILASSTSALTWSDLAPNLRHKSRFITAHPFNPPHLIPLVEIYGTDANTVSRAEALYRAAGRVPVRLNKPATGHLANRLASALWREAVNIVAEGIADVEAVDAALVNGPGLRWSVLGAHMTYHLGGGAGGLSGYLDHLGPSQERRWADLGSPSLTPEVCKALVDGVAREADGRDIATLETQRDAALIAALIARRGAPHV